jgi:4-hydroxybenzoate polyprenyltransferase
MKLLRSAFDFLLYSNIFIGLCAVALVFTNQLAIGEAVHITKPCWFVFFSTVFAYSALKLRRGKNEPASTPHHTWADNNNQLYKNVLLISLVGTASFYVTLHRDAQIMVALLAVFTGFYGFVNLPFTNGKKLRDFGLLKTLFVGMVWSVTTVLVPLAGKHPDIEMLVFLLIRRFLFVAALTIVFEVKDYEGDRLANLRTLPMVLGISGTKLLAQGLLFLLVILNVIQYAVYYFPLEGMLAISLSLLLSIIAIQPVKEELSDKYYYFVLDGMMLMQFLLVYLACLLFK